MELGAHRRGAVRACVLVPAGVLVLAGAVACGSQARPTAAGRSAAASPSAPAPVSVSVSVSGSPASSGPPPIPAATLDAVSGASPATIDVVASPGSVLAHPGTSQAAALRAALARHPHGSQVLGLSLARVKGFGFGSDMTRSQLAWLVSVDPAGGAYPAGGPGCGRLTYDVEFVDPGTGQWLFAAAGRRPGMRPLPQLGPTPHLVQPTPGCGHPVPPVHQGTPAAN